MKNRGVGFPPEHSRIFTYTVQEETKGSQNGMRFRFNLPEHSNLFSAIAFRRDSLFGKSFKASVPEDLLVPMSVCNVGTLTGGNPVRGGRKRDFKLYRITKDP